MRVCGLACMYVNGCHSIVYMYTIVYDLPELLLVFTTLLLFSTFHDIFRNVCEVPGRVKRKCKVCHASFVHRLDAHLSPLDQ